MARRRNEKQVLVPRGGRQQRRSRKTRKVNQFRPNRPPGYGNNRRNTNRSKPSGMLVFIMIIALVAFVIGAGVGVSLNLENEAENSEPAFQNVTEQMVINITNNSPSSNSLATQSSSADNNVTYV